MIPLIKEVKEALELLNSKQFEAYLVGGAVRDYLFNKEPLDYDITTSASIDDILNVFESYKTKVYANKRTVLVKIGEEHIEITPFRGNNLFEDLSSRDYKINSIAVDLNQKIYDPLNGIDDINNRKITPSYDISKMVNDDPLRMLRGIRLIYTYNLMFSCELKDYFINNVSLLDKVNSSRFRDELDRIMLLDKPSFAIREFKEIFYYFFPHLKNCYNFDQKNRYWHHLDVFEHILTVIDSVKKVPETRYAALFHDIDKPLTFTLDDKGIGHFYGHFKLSMDTATNDLFKLHYPKKFIALVAKLVYYHDRRFSYDNESIANFVEDFGFDDNELYMIFDLMMGDIKGQNPNLINRLDDMCEYQKIALNIARIRREQ